MAVAMMVDNPEGSQEAYDTVREKLGLGEARGRHLPRRRTEPERRLAGDRGVGVGGGREAVRQGAPAAGLRGSRRPVAASAPILARAQLHGVGRNGRKLTWKRRTCSTLTHGDRRRTWQA